MNEECKTVSFERKTTYGSFENFFKPRLCLGNEPFQPAIADRARHHDCIFRTTHTDSDAKRCFRSGLRERVAKFLMRRAGPYNGMIGGFWGPRSRFFVGVSSRWSGRSTSRLFIALLVALQRHLASNTSQYHRRRILVVVFSVVVRRLCGNKSVNRERAVRAVGRLTIETWSGSASEARLARLPPFAFPAD